MDHFGSSGHGYGGGGDRGGDGSRRSNFNNSPDMNLKAQAPPVIQTCADVKPRLTKEQHDVLERHFLEHHKPSTATKKGFAETLGVPLDKINVGYCRVASVIRLTLGRTGSKIAGPKSSRMLKSSRWSRIHTVQ